MRRRWASWLLWLPLCLAGCAHTLDLRLPPGEPVQVEVKPSLTTLALMPGSPPYAQLQDWMATNRGGWYPIMYTPMSNGTFVRLAGIDLEFRSAGVRAYTREGIFEKALGRCECSFLDVPSATLRAPTQ